MTEKKILNQWINCLVLITIAILLLHKKGYAISLGLLAITAVIYFFHDLTVTQSFTVSKATVMQDYGKIISVFLLFVASTVFFYLIHQEDTSYLDKPSKILIFTIVFLLLLRHPIYPDRLIIALALSAIIAGGVALYDVYHLGERAFFKMIAIQGGDIAMSLGLFNILSCLYLAKNKSKKLFLLCLTAAIFGVVASFLSASRGGWICLPLLSLMLVYVYRHNISTKAILSGTTILCILIVFFTINPTISERFSQAYYEVISYYSGGDKYTSVGGRLELWKSAVYAWQDSPAIGWGEKGITQIRLQQEAENTIIPYLANSNYHAHNQYLEELSVRGTLGFSVFMAFLLIPFLVFSKYRQYKNPEIRLFSHLGMLHIFLISTYCLTQAFFAHNSGMIFYALMTVVFYSALYNSLQNNNETT